MTRGGDVVASAFVLFLAACDCVPLIALACNSSSFTLSSTLLNNHSAPRGKIDAITRITTTTAAAMETNVHTSSEIYFVLRGGVLVEVRREASLASSDSSDESLVGLSIENGCILSDDDDDCEIEREDRDRSATGDNENNDFTVPASVQELPKEIYFVSRGGVLVEVRSSTGKRRKICHRFGLPPRPAIRMVNIDVEMDNCESSGDESSAHQQSSSSETNPESITMDQMNRPSSGWYGLVDDEYSSEDNDSDDASLCYSSDGEASLASSDSSDESLVGLSIENGCILSDDDDDCEVEREDSDRSATGDNENDDYTVPASDQQLPKEIYFVSRGGV
eukprot:CAMPEP_0196826134 /NCGR_PEP_ID=MMETSP1362-20130617/93462_1 /TAXON_ID=163516 /ORGANISM="Leptocylindrus danicus, Strain CCMP1856" /LENGTH=334 /DNA_ID=CAMNT_0042206679 /DNA_START=596 /DNA_END=1598 /DNA_ORIENTATION=-